MDRNDLTIIGHGEPAVIHEDRGLRVEYKVWCGEICVHMKIDGYGVMSTREYERRKIAEDVTECPDNARVLIGGLGFGMVLMYLAESGKTSEVLVIEKDERVLNYFKEPILKYLNENHPDFNVSVVHGDFYEEFENHGKFDWIYFDLSLFATAEDRTTFLPALSSRGVFTAF